MGPLLDGAAAIVTHDMEKAEVLNALFTSVFSSKTGLQKSEAPETKGKGWIKEDVPLVEKDEVREYLKTLDIYKSTGPDGRLAEGAGWFN